MPREVVTDSGTNPVGSNQPASPGLPKQQASPLLSQRPANPMLVAGPPPTSPAEEDLGFKLHQAHVTDLLQRVEDGTTATPDPENTFLGGSEGEFFWELVGMRLTGCPIIVLAALRFRYRELPGRG